jgi:hypothetical protein
MRGNRDSWQVKVADEKGLRLEWAKRDLPFETRWQQPIYYDGMEIPEWLIL